MLRTAGTEKMEPSPPHATRRLPLCQREASNSGWLVPRLPRAAYGSPSSA